MGSESDVIRVAVTAAKQIFVHAKGGPAKIVAVGISAATVFVGTGVGYGIYKGGEYLINQVKPKSGYK